MSEPTLRLLGPEGRMWKPAKIRLRDRVLLYRPEDGSSWRGLLRFAFRALTARWAGQGEGSFPLGGGRYDNWCGWCGHKSFTRRHMLKHQHPREAVTGQLSEDTPAPPTAVREEREHGRER